MFWIYWKESVPEELGDPQVPEEDDAENDDDEEFELSQPIRSSSVLEICGKYI